jgi:hypothetical protein
MHEKNSENNWNPTRAKKVLPGIVAAVFLSGQGLISGLLAADDTYPTPPSKCSYSLAGAIAEHD